MFNELIVIFYFLRYGDILKCLVFPCLSNLVLPKPKTQDLVSSAQHSNLSDSEMYSICSPPLLLIGIQVG